MSDYIYGSSLRAAKSKANYLFEGDFRRRPNQNFSGASRSLARGDLLQQVADQRQNREAIRRKNQASLLIQSTWRGYRSRKALGTQMRERFDLTVQKIDLSTTVDDVDINSLIREFIIFYHSKNDEFRFNALIDLLLSRQDAVSSLRKAEPDSWLFKVSRLLTMGLKLMEKCNGKVNFRYLNLLDTFTCPHEALGKHQANIVWQALIKQGIYRIFRSIAEFIVREGFESSQIGDDAPSRLLLKLIKRSLATESLDQSDSSKSPIFSLFSQFFAGPIDPIIESFYLEELMSNENGGVKPQDVIRAFSSKSLGYAQLRTQLPSTNISVQSGRVLGYANDVWLCYTFVKSMKSRVHQICDSDKVAYMNILSRLIVPAEYITNMTLMQIANNDEDLETGIDFEDSVGSDQIYRYYTESNRVITNLIHLINEQSHIDSLKPIIFNHELQSNVHMAIIQICNLMLAHEHLAIFNCRLLYTVAFSREFSRLLWKSIISATGATLYGTNTPTYLQIIRGNNVCQNSWESILPPLRLFSSLYSYLLPTLDDEEFYTVTEVPSPTLTGAIHSDSDILESSQHFSVKRQNATNSFFIDRELISISATLKDICVGFIEILYQDDRHSQHQSWTRSEQDEHSRLLSFEIKSCFKALVRLVCQLHARDSRKRYCPEGHWISKSLVIPANKALDFQLVTSQQGRLLSQMTRDDKIIESIHTPSNEIKTVLILQEIPFVISFHDRVQLLHQLLRKEKQMNQSEGYFFGLPGTAIQVQIRRNYIYEDAFDKLSYENEPNMKLPLKVSLINSAGADEAGIDGGGLSKEFLSELLRAGFDPMRGFFKSTKDQLLYPNPSANVLFYNLPEGFAIHYEFLGRILGKAIFEKIMVELPLASFFLAKLLARKHSSDVDLHNLASLDPVLYKNLVYLKNYEGDVADLNLDFTISNNELGEHEIIELKPGGSKVPVTRENKIEYVHLVADYRLNKQIRAQCAAFKRGLSQLIDLDWLRMFDPRELQILISGAPTMIDTDDWRRHTLYANGYSDDSEAINVFWQVVSQFDESLKRKLLKFTTSCSLPPLLGFKDLVPQFTIAPSEEARLPSASTCMNLLKLPQCGDEKTMRSKLLYAIESNSGFELS